MKEDQCLSFAALCPQPDDLTNVGLYKSKDTLYL